MSAGVFIIIIIIIIVPTTCTIKKQSVMILCSKNMEIFWNIMCIYSEVNLQSPKIILENFGHHLISDDWGIAAFPSIVNSHCATFKRTTPLVHINTIRNTIPINSSLWKMELGYTAHLTAGMIQNTHSSWQSIEWQLSANWDRWVCVLLPTPCHQMHCCQLCQVGKTCECQVLNIFNILDMPCITPENTFLYIVWNAWYAN